MYNVPQTTTMHSYQGFIDVHYKKYWMYHGAFKKKNVWYTQYIFSVYGNKLEKNQINFKQAKEFYFKDIN